ncbi:MAG: hypothetical protein KDD11_07990 [Acidobacteria bacterium]|nr:hypothetical protein [Acidobacteriota bacterium]
MNRDPSEAIIEARKDLVEDLDRLFQPFDLSSFSELAPVIEGFIEQYVNTAIRDHREVLASSAGLLGAGAFLEIGGVRIRTGVALDLWAPSVLEIVIVPDEEPPARRPRSRKIAIEGVGRVREVRLLVAPELDIDTEQLELMVKTTLESGYSWLREKFRLALASEEDSMAGEVYSHLRAILPDQEVWERVWLWSYVDGEGAYLGDPKLSDAKLLDIRGHPLAAGKSPVELLVTALTTLSHLSDSFTQEAIKSGEPIDVDLRTALYGDDEPVYVVSERLLFGESALTIYPIVRSGRGLFLAGFPARLRSELIPIFDRHREELGQRFLVNRSKINRLLRKLAGGQPERIPQLVELAGRFTRGILGLDQ